MRSNDRNNARGDDVRPDVPQSKAGGRHVRRDPEMIPDHIIDAFFDDELNDQKTDALFRALRHRPDSARDIASMQHALDSLRRPVSSPDLADRILNEVHVRRGWLSQLSRRRVHVGRYAAVLLLLVMVGAMFMAQRNAPNLMTLTPRQAPLGELVSAVSDEAGDAMGGMEFVRRQFDVLSDQMANLAPAPSSQPRTLDRLKTVGIVPSFDVIPISSETESADLFAADDPYWDRPEAIGSASISEDRTFFIRASFLRSAASSSDVPRIISER